MRISGLGLQYPSGLFCIGLVVILGEAGTSLVHSSSLQNKLSLDSETSFDSFPRAHGPRHRRTAVYSDDQLWTNATIPYVITDDVAAAPKLMAAIDESIDLATQQTCIRFRNVTTEEAQAAGGRYVVFVLGRTCQSHVGMLAGEGPQDLTLAPTCGFVNLILHEMGHLFGLWHEHTRSDRDNNVLVLLDNVRPHHAYNFDTVKRMRLLAPYDLTSLMHYDVTTMSVNGERTIQPLHEDLVKLVGYRRDFSFYDRYTLNKLYGCSGHCPKNMTCAHGGYVDSECHCVCPSRVTGSHCQHVDTHIDCGGVIYLTSNETEVNVTSPGYPGRYPNKRRCTWLIDAAPGSVLTLRVPEFDLEMSSRGSCRDLLEVRYHHVGIQQGPKFCGKSFDQNIRSTSHIMLLHFQSNSRTRRKGFRAVITRTNATDCESSPCLNNGTCSEDAPIGTYYCACASGWLGHNCDVYIADGGWTKWSEWSHCVATCGRRERYRACTDPPPTNGGKECVGSTVETETCGDPKACESAFTCGFGKGIPGDMCGIVQESDLDDLSWQINRGHTLSLNTGPTAGHTTGEDADNYLYVEGSDGINHETSAVWLPTRPFGRYCLQFYYHMRGRSMGTLAVIRRTRKGKPRVVWQRSGHQGDNWVRVNMDVLFHSSIQVGFGAVRGDGYESDFAIDDVSISKRSCEFTHEEGEVPRYGDYGCGLEGKRYGTGRFTVKIGCTQKNCFCNQDSSIDCPEWRFQNICPRYPKKEPKKPPTKNIDDYKGRVGPPMSSQAAQPMQSKLKISPNKYIPYSQRKKTSRSRKRKRPRTRTVKTRAKGKTAEIKKPFWLL